MNRLALAVIAAAAGTAPVLAAAPPKPAETPELYQALLRCRTMTDRDARLACFEEATDQLSAAIEKRDIVVLDRQQVTKTKKTLFGLPIPDLGLFGSEGDGNDEVTQVDGVVAAVGQNGDGRWTIILKDGARWQQIDDRPLALSPKPGDTVVIHRAAMGSFMMRINGHSTIRVKRFV